MPAMDLLQRLQAGDIRALSRTITAIENGRPEAEEILMTAADEAERLQGEGAEFIVKNASVSQIRRLLPDARIIRILR